MVTYKTIPIGTCYNCNAHNLCETADEHREREGYSKISVNSNECNECKEKYADNHAPDKVRGTDKGSEGSGSGPSEAVNEPES